jgi:hypothetical protein
MMPRTRVVVASAAVCLLAFLIGKAAVDWRLRRLDEALQNQVAEAPIQPDQPPDYPPPGDLFSAVLKSGDFRVYRSVADVPGSVRSAFAKAARENSFSMADPNGRWEATDVISDPQLPRRRLVSVGVGGQLCLLFYEHGGIGRNDNVAAFRISNDHAEPIWHAFIDSNVRNPTALARALQEEKYLESPFF